MAHPNMIKAKYFTVLCIFLNISILQAQEESSHLDSLIMELKSEYKSTSSASNQSAIAMKLSETLLQSNQAIEAEPWIDIAINHFAQHNINDQLSEAYFIKGRVIFNIDPNRSDEALNYYYKSIETGSEKSKSQYRTYGSIARILQNNRDLENSLKYHKLSMNGALEYQDWSSYIRACVNLCILYNGKTTLNLDSSVHYGLKGLNLAREKELDYYAAVAHNVVTAPIIRKGNYSEGLKMAYENLKLAKKYPLHPVTEFIQHINLGFAYIGLEKLDSAQMMADKAQKLNPESAENARLNYEIKKAKGNFKAALEHLERYKHQHDSVLEANFNHKFSENQSRLEANQKTQEVKLLEKEADISKLQLRQQRILILALGLFLFLAIGLGILYTRQQKLKKEKSLSDMEQRLLRSQMNPHFIFNSMTAIQHYMMTKGAEEASHYMGTFSRLMRQILDHSRQEFISLGEEIETLRNYMELQQMRFDNQFDYEIELDEELDEDYHHLPPMFAQPFIENALEHGLFKKDRENKINISFKAKGSEQIALEINDTGTGLIESSQSNHKSLATRITQERLAIFKRTLKAQSELLLKNNFDAEGNIQGLRVNLTLPTKVILPA
ncbi:sensor histidine kinase [Reichenbachiella ulvae]|uniref:Histidine kinase n=1 Tax=Reichenbachiella ulvae TaxID=2980104 RepID=A0ABT3CNJ8_9BACT|nr:sensor histidine kinase [Reichenbachiella ulvae]MCV9385184.1 histidine kinase [Reichenbachiella ulvae]